MIPAENGGAAHPPPPRKGPKRSNSSLDHATMRAVVSMQSHFRGWKTRKNIMIKSLQYYTEAPPPTRADPHSDDGLAPKDAALLLAAQEGDHAKIQRLCKENMADRTTLPIQDNKGRTPLMRAIQANQTVAALLLLRYNGARVGVKDHHGRSSLSYAIARSNLALILALISSICGLAGDATTEVAAALSSQEVGRLYLALSNVDALQAGRATALVFLTDAKQAMLIMVRAITAVREKAELVKQRDTDRAELLFVSARTLEAAVAALLCHAKELIKPVRRKKGDLGLRIREAAKSPRATFLKSVSSITKLNAPGRRASLGGEAGKRHRASIQETFNVGKNAPKEVGHVTRREGAASLLSASLSALDVAAKFGCKHLLNNFDIRGYLEDQWHGQLTENERAGKSQSTSGGQLAAEMKKEKKVGLKAMMSPPGSPGGKGGGKGGPVTRKLARRATKASICVDAAPARPASLVTSHHGAHANLVEGMESRMNISSPNVNSSPRRQLSNLNLAPIGSMKFNAPAERRLEDFWVGAHVEHAKHGAGKVSHFTKDARMSVDFHNGDTHAYGVASLHKVEIVEDTEELDSDDHEEVELSFVTLLMCVPSYLVQGLVLWVPLSLWPPLATKLKTTAGPWYYLDVPSFKFYSSFASDIAFVFSLTALSQPDHSQLHAPLIRAFGHRSVVICHLIWVISILISELGQFLWSKYAEIVDLKEVILGVYYTGNPLEAAGNALTLVVDIFTLDSLIEVCDLFGPTLAFIALIDETRSLGEYDSGDDPLLQKGQGGFSTRRERRQYAAATMQEGDDGTWEDVLDTTRVMCYAGGLLLLAWRMLRPMMMVSATLGTLIHVIDSMLIDVFRWIVIQTTLICGYTSALYALVGDPASTSTGIFPEACEMLSMSDKMTRQGGFRVWLNIFELLIENFLMQEANLSCMRLYAAYPVVTWWLMVTFQLLSAVLMINMLIAMMAKTFDKIQDESAVNFNFLRAQIILTWVERDPSPPPFNLINIAVGYPAYMLTRCVAHVRDRRKQAKAAKAAKASSSSRNILGDMRDLGATMMDLGAQIGEGFEDAFNETTGLEELHPSLAADGSKALRPALSSDSTNEHFSLIADFHDEQHVRKVSQMFTSHIAEALTADPAPGVKELKIQIEHSSKEHAKALASIKEELTAKVSKEARAASEQSDVLKQLLLEQQAALKELKRMAEGSALGASIGEQVRRRRTAKPAEQSRLAPEQASYALYATHAGEPHSGASTPPPVGAMTDHEFKAWMGGPQGSTL
tara:strand:+ start:216 stop:4025 length:3810 start_codon:yes stop_codon:yes gene_type:complete